jgi:Heparinase II/III-like protein
MSVTRAVVVGALLALTAQQPANAADAPRPHRMPVQTETSDVATVTPDSLCPPASPDPVPDGQPIVVELPPADPFTVGQIPAAVWRNPWVADPTWRVWFESLRWLMPLARRAQQDGQRQSLATIIDQVIAFQVQNPDPGVPLYGWDEGTAQRRLETLNCLYSLTHDAALIPSMKANVAVQLGSRYYGPPYHPVHNHGLMANIRMYRAGQLLGISSWIDKAVYRMGHEAPLAFSGKGFTWEQSSHYQKYLIDLWNAAAATLGSGSVVDTILANTTRGRGVFRWLTEPDGRIVQLGDAAKIPGLPGSSSLPTLRDDAAGYVIGRWSWSDPKTSYYTLRYGPPLRAHGHQDRAGVTWTTAGARVLVGPGYYTTAANRWRDYQRGPQGQNVATVANGTLRTGVSVGLVTANVGASAHGYQMSDALYGYTHRRYVNVSNPLRTLKVTDTFPSGTGWVRQYWHLDSAWTIVSKSPDGRRLVFAHPSGRRLTITSTGALYWLVRGSTSPVAGWNFPEFGKRVAGYQVVFKTSSTRIDTVFVVS